jgi:hypothetical protein
MDSKEKRKLSSLKNIEIFRKTVKKLNLNEVLTEQEKEYLLASAIILTKEYELNKEYTGYLEFAYYIILKYSIKYNDYKPLYDFSINFGYYPISDTITKLNLIQMDSIDDIIIKNGINKFKKKDIVETYEQKYNQDKFIHSNNNEIAYIAPTSYGKSSIISEKILTDRHNKIGIIVPTKSLINQTYNFIKQQILNYKIIMFDEMYEDDDEKFIAIITQERGLRLLERNNFYFEQIFVDEAHNLLLDDERSILLSRLINKNYSKNPNQKIVYLSPLVDNSKNLKSYNEGNIDEYKINFNLKEPEIFELRLDGEVLKYNRFMNEFYILSDNYSVIDYIRNNEKNKNFIFIARPVKIEKFAKEIKEHKELETNNDELNLLADTLKKYVHEDFNVIDLIKHGIVYIHGKMPDQIKDYLEYKYKTIKELRYLIANHVILEGINLPIDNLYIMTVNSLNTKQIVNLIGRVNRLNDVFTPDTNNLDKLLPQIHFINTEEYNRKDSNMSNTIEKLRSFDLDDRVENPILVEYNENKLKISDDKKEKNRGIIEKESKLFSDDDSEDATIEKIMIECGIDSYYDNITEVIERIKKVKKEIIEDLKWKDLNIIDKICYIFIDSIISINDYEIKRLKYIETKDFYKNFIKMQKFQLKDRIKNQYRYFKSIQYNNEKNEFYIGKSYGEIAKITDDYKNNFNKVYIKLDTKTDKELLNLAIVKLKIEDDFINYKINGFLQAMLKMEFISQEEYNEIVYGTNDKKKLNLMKKGLTYNLINKFENDNQIENLSFDQYNNIIINDKFKEYRDTLDDFLKFEINKYI